MSHVERSVICLHCQKVHSPGFMWNFSEKARVCFTCYREMGEDGRKQYERGVVPGVSKKKTGYAYATRVVGILAILIAILGASAYYLYKPLTEEVAQHRVEAGESQVSARR